MSHPPNSMSPNSESGTKSLIFGTAFFGALAEPDGSHLGERPDRLAEVLAHRKYPGHDGRSHRPHPRDENAEFAIGRFDIIIQFSCHFLVGRVAWQHLRCNAHANGARRFDIIACRPTACLARGFRQKFMTSRAVSRDGSIFDSICSVNNSFPAPAESPLHANKACFLHI